MPLNKYKIEPTNVSTHQTFTLPTNETNVLEGVSNFTLANLMRQIASLSQTSIKIFDELSQEATKINERTINLNKRISDLSAKISGLDVDKEAEDNAQHVNVEEKYNLHIKLEKKLFKKSEMPSQIKVLYEKAEAPPDLSQFDAFRDDGKSSMKMFSDPDYYLKKCYARLKKKRESEQIPQSSRKKEEIFDKSTSINNLSMNRIGGEDKVSQHVNQQTSLDTQGSIRSHRAPPPPPSQHHLQQADTNQSQISTDKLSDNMTNLKTFENGQQVSLMNRKSLYQEMQAGKVAYKNADLSDDSFDEGDEWDQDDSFNSEK